MLLLLRHSSGGGLVARDEGAEALARKVTQNRKLAAEQARDAEIKTLLLTVQAKQAEQVLSPTKPVTKRQKVPLLAALSFEQELNKTKAVLNEITAQPLADDFDIDLIMALFIEMI